MHSLEQRHVVMERRKLPQISTGIAVKGWSVEHIPTGHVAPALRDLEYGQVQLGDGEARAFEETA